MSILFLEAVMINRIKLTLEQPEYSALLEASLQELRNPADQARYIIRQELERRGLLPEATAVKGGSSEQ
jgi:hypothetical protein